MLTSCSQSEFRYCGVFGLVGFRVRTYIHTHSHIRTFAARRSVRFAICSTTEYDYSGKLTSVDWYRYLVYQSHLVTAGGSRGAREGLAQVGCV